MDTSVQRLLTDKLYDKRKQGALELEKLVREACANKDHEKIRRVVDQLCHEYAYAVHQPHARNGGLIGLAAASIALGSDEVARYLKEIVPPVLACFTDQDARVRYYACEAMYNIAKVAKGEILLFFNDIFDALCKLAADSELSVKNGAELLDRLVKDIVAESAASYVSVLDYNERTGDDGKSAASARSSLDIPTAFSLERFIPLLEERIHVINPFTRTFLVSWLTLLDTIPDLELVHYLPAFLGGLFKFLSDSNRDVYVATQGLLDRFLSDITKIAKIKRGIAESRRSRASARRRRSDSQAGARSPLDSAGDDNAIDDSEPTSGTDDEDYDNGDWIPGQDVEINYAKILDILLRFVDVSSNRDSAPGLRIEGLSKQKEEEIGIVALRWIGTFFEVSPEDILPFVPRLLSQVLPALSAQSEAVRTTANGVNRALMDYIVRYHEDAESDFHSEPVSQTKSVDKSGSRDTGLKTGSDQATTQPDSVTEQTGDQDQASPRSSQAASPEPINSLDYAAAVNSLTLQFLNEHEATRVAALSWLIMLHRKAPKKVLAFNDGTFPALLKTLSDPAEAVVTRDLQLLSQISRNSDDKYFSSFMVALLQLFSTDRKLLEIRGNLIIRQLCINLMPERIYRTLADCIEKDEDVEFASIMVQNLNNNLITAPELAELRKRLRNLDNKEGQAFFITLFKAWCYNAVATFSLCLLAQAYEQAYGLLQIFADLEMTVNMLIQIDKLVQLLESPVFTYLRLQLLEPDRYPYLYKCLYGLLMLLPQSSAFAALKNRLNSVSAVGMLHTPASMPSRTSMVSGISSSNIPNAASSTSTTASRLSGRPGVSVPGRDGLPGPGFSDLKWNELLDKFKATQERARRRTERLLRGDDDDASLGLDGSNDEGVTASNVRGRVRPSFSGSSLAVPGGRNSRASAREALSAMRPGAASSTGLGVSGGTTKGAARGSLVYPSTLRSGIGGNTTGQATGAGANTGGPPTLTSLQTPESASDKSSATGGQHKSKHSLTGGFGKMVGGFRSQSSKDKDKDKDKDGSKDVSGRAGSAATGRKP